MQEFKIWWSDLTEQAQNEIMQVMGVTRDAMEYYSNDFYITSIYLPVTDDENVIL